MLLPSTNVGAPPTRFALKARPVFAGILVLQSLLMFGRFFIMDLWGAMLTMLVVLMGTFVISSTGGMDTTYCMYYGLMCLVNGIFDIILCIERWVHVKYTFFSHGAPTMFNVGSVVFLLCPVVEMAATMLSAYIYIDAQEAESRLMFPQYFTPASEAAAVRESLQAAAQGRGQQDQSFVAFQGRCHHL
mmetsp:Transcript_47765/g.103992  ORF Transcript_47765/g.103992 Transcript_47765/m.103992 type:complete len:188 (-) Transcript_47765:60-623(-)